MNPEPEVDAAGVPHTANRDLLEGVREVEVRTGTAYRVAIDGVVPCQYGQIFILAPGVLGAWCRVNRLRPPLLEIPGVEIVRDGDADFVIRFPFACFPAVASLMRAQRRPKDRQEGPQEPRGAIPVDRPEVGSLPES